jgi:hypothetical protein
LFLASVRIWTARSTSRMKSLPSPILAACVTAAAALSTKSPKYEFDFDLGREIDRVSPPISVEARWELRLGGR